MDSSISISVSSSIRTGSNRGSSKAAALAEYATSSAVGCFKAICPMHPRSLPLRLKVTKTPAHSRVAISGGHPSVEGPLRTAVVMVRRATVNSSSFS